MLNYNLEKALEGPTKSFIFGFDAYGVDLVLRLKNGLIFSFEIGILVALTSTLIGFIFGVVLFFSKDKSKFIYSFLYFLLSFALAFPQLILIIFLTFLLHSSYTKWPMTISIVILSATHWANKAVLVQNLLITEINRFHVKASLALGSNKFHLFKTHLLQSLIPHISIQFIYTFLSAILAEAGLSFLGFFSESPSLGKLLSESREYLIEAPHLFFFPTFFLIILVCSLRLVTETLRKKIKTQ